MAREDTAQILDRLNPTERELLILLGRGHTAKSIATLKGVSVAAVNERFRSARRKTGLASSGEIARLLTAQENRDDLIDLAAASAGAPSLPRPDAQSSGRASLTRRWRLIVITAALLAAGLLAYETATPPAAIPVSAPTTSSIQNSRQRRARPDPEALKAEMANGSRDAVWSPLAEQALSRSYRQVAAFDESVPTVRITCTSSVCEIAGETRPDLSGADRDQLMAAFLALKPSDGQVRLTSVSHRFGYRPDGHEAGVYVAYWRRSE